MEHYEQSVATRSIILRPQTLVQHLLRVLPRSIPPRQRQLLGTVKKIIVKNVLNTTEAKKR